MNEQLSQEGQIAYLYFDEAGNFDYSKKGSEYLILTCVQTQRPFQCAQALNDLRFSLLEDGIAVERFHACDDRKWLRERVFGIISQYVNDFRICWSMATKTALAGWMDSPGALYCQLFQDISASLIGNMRQLPIKRHIAVTDHLPNEVRKKAYEHQMRHMLSDLIQDEFTIAHHHSMSDMNLQIADYICWAIQRKYEQGDPRWFNMIESAVVSHIEYDEVEWRT